MRTYLGLRYPDGRAYVEVEEDGRRRPLLHARLHSPSGLEWGYGGSGPADTALSLLLDFFDEWSSLRERMSVDYSSRNYQLVEGTKAWQLHGEFKQKVVAGLGRHVPVGAPYAEPSIAEVLPAVEEWRLTDEQVRVAVQEILDQGRRCLTCLAVKRQTPDGLVCMNWRCKQSPFYFAEETP